MDDDVDVDDPAEALVAAVETAFARTSTGLRTWDDPHPPPDRLVADEEYSRLTDPERYLIVGARVDAWIDALRSSGAVDVVVGGESTWIDQDDAIVVRTDRVRARVDGAIDLVVARTRLGDVDGAGVWLGVARPGEARVAPVALVPDCGCDACDSGSQDLIDVVDDSIRPIVDGSLRHLRRERRRGRVQTVTVWDDGRREAHDTDRRDVDAILADPKGWEEWSGSPWLAGGRGTAHH